MNLVRQCCLQIYNGTVYDHDNTFHWQQAKDVANAWQEFFGPAGLGTLPEEVHYFCCAQFVVRKEHIRSRPRKFYLQVSLSIAWERTHWLLLYGCIAARPGMKLRLQQQRALLQRNESCVGDYLGQVVYEYIHSLQTSSPMLSSLLSSKLSIRQMLLSSSLHRSIWQALSFIHKLSTLRALPRVHFDLPGNIFQRFNKYCMR